ncbi:hypothetical protein COT66_01225 [Candidatus Shapirobacteria bacterium CG09_land_8_20_14_0_10_49_15]|uniref:Uncharacterized protein n=2 Tax=Candidatus Shapironibacteriota TaxID=1752721 RepID=A0A2M8L6G7_9BACT|nr:MAG: hypothetical protein COT66_01225 [Candidatus Shapirobacteria bacterium CG09_land_8_20_14_0_10_49_15]PJE69829.1 MAG: hypothetical protein COU97_03050 [Candidatus Shapirobacteria bacterium CG10_big_fil_rev_8_21_14_0_10_48_15]
MKLANYKKAKIAKKTKEAKISILVLVVVASVLILAGIQLAIAHQLATTGGQIRAFEQETSQLQTANLQLGQVMREAGALAKVAERAQALGLKRNPIVVYLPAQVTVASAD